MTGARERAGEHENGENRQIACATHVRRPAKRGRAAKSLIHEKLHGGRPGGNLNSDDAFESPRATQLLQVFTGDEDASQGTAGADARGAEAAVRCLYTTNTAQDYCAGERPEGAQETMGELVFVRGAVGTSPPMTMGRPRLLKCGDGPQSADRNEDETRACVGIEIERKEILAASLVKYWNLRKSPRSSSFCGKG